MLLLLWRHGGGAAGGERQSAHAAGLGALFAEDSLRRPPPLLGLSLDLGLWRKRLGPRELQRSRRGHQRGRGQPGVRLVLWWRMVSSAINSVMVLMLLLLL